ncbi:MAG: hypothetical protein JEZ09_17495 [Salinivirgaceae bacterium]|nr:hypothetical protein [Salinivirgaceae bacterium]
MKIFKSNNFWAFFIFLTIAIQFHHSSLIAQNYSQTNKAYVVGNTVINSTDNANSDLFYEEVIEEIIFDEINRILATRGFDLKTKDTLLQKAAEDQAIYMLSINDDEIIQENKKKQTTGDRILFYGGSKNGCELVKKTNISKGKIPYTYGKIASDIVFYWFSNTKKSEILEDISLNRIGISAKLDDKKRKVYVSVVFGNYKSHNEGPKHLEELPVAYTTKSYGLDDNNPLYCKKIDRKDDLLDLQANLSVEGNAIYFETDNIKNIKRIIRKKKDGLAVDILQKEQYSCGSANIVDYNLLNSGILTKRLYTKKLFKNNLADLENNPNAFKTQLAMLPEGISNNYELNLVIIQNKSVCKSIPKNFTITPSGKYTKNISLLADTVSINSRFSYKPIADSMSLTFRIPFENKKTSYKTKDIEPFIKLLNEPAFVIYNMLITAYSSIEGTDSENNFLQQKRAESIVKVLGDRQSDIINTNILTEYNWSDFQKDILNTNHNILASMKLDEAQAYIKDYNLNKELEPILKNHRYAQIDMKVTYDISGENEKPYVIKKFNSAIAENDRALALSIQKFFMKQIELKRYLPNSINELLIPEKSAYAGLHMNSLWLKYITNQISDEDFATKLNEIYLLDPSNEYIVFNKLFAQISNEKIADLNMVSNLQTQVDRLYYTPLKKKTVDGLNIKLQFKLIAFADSISTNNKIKEECIERIKQIVNIKEESLNNALKLTELYIENNDYLFALKTLEPWVKLPSANEKLFYTYISLCSRYEERMHTNNFNYAMQRARELNPNRFCELFNGEYFSLKVFENSLVKKEYCKFCNSDNNVVFEQ